MCIRDRLILVVFRDHLLTLTYGAFYSDGHILLAILALGAISDVVLGPCGITLIMSGNQITHLRIQLISGLLAISASIVSGLLWGTMGVACVTALAALSQNLATLYFAKRKTGLLCCSYLAPRNIWRVALGIKNLSSNFVTDKKQD